MTVSPEKTAAWCTQLVQETGGFAPLEKCLEAIPSLDSLAKLPAGTRILVRGDTDVKVDSSGKVKEDERLKSLIGTLKFCLEHKFIPILYGHMGRKPELSLAPVAKHISGLLSAAGAPATVDFVPEWMNNDTGEILDSAVAQVSKAAPGTTVLLENTRRYSLEQYLWKATPESIARDAGKLAAYANGMRKLAAVHINEGFASSNMDLSSTLVPLTMDQVALGAYISKELREHVTKTRLAELVVFSGIKLEKLTDLEQILARGTVKMVICAGSLALSLIKAAKPDFKLGLSGDPVNKEIYIGEKHLAQARRMLEDGRSKGIEFVLPVDFVLGDESVSDFIPDGQAQFDVGPKTRAVQQQKVGEFIEFHNQKLVAGKGPAYAFHNGVFGKFEEERFSHGTREFMKQLKRLTEAGVQTYVGGGEGGSALMQYGDESWVTHCFTAGGTILKALGNEPIPYLKALYLKCQGT
ncbi:MAG: phosphoglycerate kinase [Planctomycetaceae bacterium]|nr:phosphoglycerate kinase [Planctomycetaceae bacterium]